MIPQTQQTIMEQSGWRRSDGLSSKGAAKGLDLGRYRAEGAGRRVRSPTSTTPTESSATSRRMRPGT